MDIHQLALEPGEDIYHDPDFQIMIESHFTYLRGLSTTVSQAIEPGIGHKYEGDFYGLLSYLKIPKKYHNIVLRFNGFHCTGDYNRNILSITVPSLNEIDLIKSVYETRTSKF